MEVDLEEADRLLARQMEAYKWVARACLVLDSNSSDLAALQVRCMQN